MISAYAEELHKLDMNYRWPDKPLLYPILDNFISTLLALGLSDTYLGESEEMAERRRETEVMIEKSSKLLAEIENTLV